MINKVYQRKYKAEFMLWLDYQKEAPDYLGEVARAYAYSKSQEPASEQVKIRLHVHKL